MTWSEAKKAMKDGKKISNDRDGRIYVDKQGEHFVCHYRYEGDKDWTHWLLDKADIALFSQCVGWFIVKEVEQ